MAPSTLSRATECFSHFLCVVVFHEDVGAVFMGLLVYCPVSLFPAVRSFYPCVASKLRKAFLSLLAVLWNSAFRWVYLSFSLLPLASLLFTAICKASSDNHFAFLHFFFLGVVLIIDSCTVLGTFVRSSSGTLIRSNPLTLFVTSTT